ncbi:lipase/esterase [Pseudohyphozyma bogoriensis]|nr:lipase/esterase [Pseudohyphozyma bogoriensis]
MVQPFALAASLVALALTASAAPLARRSPGDPVLKAALQRRQSVTTSPGNDVAVLNFARALELVDIDLFFGALDKFSEEDFKAAGFPSGARGTVQRIAEDEQEHADFIAAAVKAAGGTPVQACKYTFPYDDLTGFMALSGMIEGVGTSAYIGSLGAFEDPDHTTGGATVLAVETRHNALLRYLNKQSPDPAGQDTPLSAMAVTSLAAGFFVPNSCPEGSALAFKPFPALNVTTTGTLKVGDTVYVEPETPFSKDKCDKGVYCGFASGAGAFFSEWKDGSCTVPYGVTPGQTYLALTSAKSISDAHVLAGMAILQVVDGSKFLDLSDCTETKSWAKPTKTWSAEEITPTKERLTTLVVAGSATPTFLSTFIKHFLYHRKTRKGKPTSQLSYDEGLAIIARFLAVASKHPLNELQHFTANHVPVPRWVQRIKVEIPDSVVQDAAAVLRRQLAADPDGLEKVGGARWWEFRGKPLSGEWIEMKKDVLKRGGAPPDRVLFYVHGGAYFFSSLETHRYQIQRHAHILAAYMYVINPPEGSSHTPVAPSKIIFSGDSAGAGALVSLLVLLRDQGLPLPAGTVLISPWVDLSHSFPSITADDSGDYIPSSGFHFKPSLAWPPAKGDALSARLLDSVDEVLLDDQFQMFCPNTLLNHPLVSPVCQGSLGGLPPLMILLRDEMIYLAHKAASPTSYPPPPSTLATYPSQAAALEKHYPPTNVHLQIYDGTAHVTPTLSITTPARFQYRGAANFGLWALTVARKKEDRKSRRKSSSDHSHHGSGAASTRSSKSSGSTNEPTVHPADWSAANEEEHEFDEESESEYSSDEEEGSPEEMVRVTGKEPSFVDHMVRERVSFNGKIRAMEPASELPACNVRPEEIGLVKAGPVRKWLAKRAAWDKTYEKELKKYRAIREADRLLAEVNGFLTGTLHGERPPLCSLAGWHNKEMALECGDSVDETGKKENIALAMWASISAAPDEEQVGGKDVAKKAERIEDSQTGGRDEVKVNASPKLE